MESLSIGEINGASMGILMNSIEGLMVRGVSIDSRKINPGDMFIALKGESFDGHDFIDKAIENGAALVVTQKILEGYHIPYILVKDTLKALHNISGYYRNKFQIPFIAVTGSSGKTTTKDMIASVMSQKYNIHKTEGNFNNAIGLPLTLLELNKSHDMAVLEMGMNSLGEIELLSSIVRQNIGVISNVGTAHIEKLGSKENILKAKLEIFSNFDRNCTAVINGDNDMLAYFNSDRYRVVRYGLNAGNEIQAYEIDEKGEEGIAFAIDIEGVRESFKVMLPGIHNVYNALSAIAVARLFGMDAEHIRRGLLSFKPSKMRMDIVNLKSGIRIINDVYNANPESMKAAINVLKSLKSKDRTICMLGDMLELGDISAEEHYNIGRYAATAGVDVLAAVGSFSEDMRRGAEASGMKRSNIYTFSTTEEAIASLNDIVASGDVVLLKGSRRMRMEDIVDFLRERG